MNVSKLVYRISESINHYRYNEPKVSDIDPYLCTHLHLINSFKHDENCKIIYPNNEEILDMLNLKTKNPQLKILITLTPNNTCMSKLVSVMNSTSLNSFITEVTDLVRKKKIDGVDLDWEFPNWSKDASETDKAGFKLRESFDKQYPKPLISVAVPGPYHIAKAAYDISALNRNVDFVQTMNYDFHVYSKQLPFAALNAPLFKESFFEFGLSGRMNSDYSTKYWVQNGLSKRKILFGIPTYGRGFTLVSSKLHFVFAPAKGVSKLGDSVTYSQVSNMLSKSPYLYGKDKQWFSYEDRLSTFIKAKYAKSTGLAGIMIFDLNSDDFSGKCGQGKYPLIRAAKLGFEEETANKRTLNKFQIP
uniref:Glyco_18 domain-containing protein n=1 Tax=Syphacia muris TaxID=451379 RepID=A0A0N5ABV8_9BILA